MFRIGERGASGLGIIVAVCCLGGCSVVGSGVRGGSGLARGGGVASSSGWLGRWRSLFLGGVAVVVAVAVAVGLSWCL